MDRYSKSRSKLDVFDANLEEVSAQIEEGFCQAERGELIDGEQVRQELEVWKREWRSSRQ